MTLNKISSELSYKILSLVKVKDYEKHLNELNNTIAVALSKMYIKGRNHERDSVNWQLLDNDVVYFAE